MMTKQQLMHELEVIPPFAASLMRLTDIILSGKYTIDDVSKIIRLDQGLTIDVISYANSVESGPAKDITSVQDSIVRMGGARIMRFLLSKWFRGNVAATLGNGKESQGLWKHGIFAAVAADVIAEEMPSLRHPASFTAALLHDIGRIPFGRWALRNKMQFEWTLDDIEMSTQETQLFGYTHADVGAMVLEKWHFPEVIVEAVRFHSMSQGGPAVVTEVIRLANLVCRALEPDCDQRVLAAIDIAQRNQIDIANLKELAMRTKEQSVKILQEFGAS